MTLVPQENNVCYHATESAQPEKSYKELIPSTWPQNTRDPNLIELHGFADVAVRECFSNAGLNHEVR